MDHQIAQIIKDFNLDAYKPIIPRELDLGMPLEPRVGNLATVIMGMRRGGKTYRIFQQMQAIMDCGVPASQLLYFNFEDDRLSPVTTQTGDEVLQTYFAMNPDAYDTGVYCFFDEIQEMREWDRWLRRVIDTTKATIYVTGSSSKLLSEDVATAFRGRSIAYELTPYSFREFVTAHEPSFPGNDTVWTGMDVGKASGLFKQYLRLGGFPGVQHLIEQQAILVLQGYAQRVVAKDVLERHNMGNPQAITLFAQRLLANSGHEYSLRKTEHSFRSQGVPVGRDTLAQALAYFEDAFLLSTVHDFSRAIAVNPRTSPKVYAIDPGLVFANSPASSQDDGARLETAVYMELRRRNPASRTGSIASLRTKEHGYEIDFVVGDALDQRGMVLIQVCEQISDQDTAHREQRALEEAMREHHLREGYLIIAVGQRMDIPTAQGTIHQIPAWQWCLQRAG